MHQLPELVRLHRLGTAARGVARLLGVSPNTEREYRLAFAKAGFLEGLVDDLPALETLMRRCRAWFLGSRPRRSRTGRPR